MMIRQATMADFAAICDLYAQVCSDMVNRGNDQWVWGEYPNETVVQADIVRNDMYVLDGEAGLDAVLTINCEQDAEYHETNYCKWHGRVVHFSFF